MKRTIDHIRDELLVLQFQSGDTGSFSELVTRWHRRLLRHVRNLTNGHEEAADIVQEVWMNAARGLHRLEDPACFPIWIYRIATARCADWIRRQTRERTMTNDVKVETELAYEEATPNTDGDIADLRRAMARLPAGQKAVLDMFYLDDMSIVEIAVALAVPVGTVKSRLHTARNHLREIMERSEL